MEIESVQHENLEEAEMGQLHALHLNMNAEAAIRARIKEGPGLAECEDCGDPIPEERKEAISGCTTCVSCQGFREDPFKWRQQHGKSNKPNGTNPSL